MGLYNTPQSIRPISSSYPQRPNQSQPRSQTYHGININTQPKGYPNIKSHSPTNLTLENASLHSQLITLKRELARREALQAQMLRERREAEVVSAGTRLSPQFYSQIPAQYQTQAQTQFPGQSRNQYQNQTPIQPQLRSFPAETDSALRAAIEDLHASIREFADVYGCSDLDGRESGKGREKEKSRGAEKARRAGDKVGVWSEIPAVLKSGVREVDMRGERERGVFLPAVLKGSQSTKRRSSTYSSSSSSSESKSRDRESGRHSDRYGDRQGKRESSVQTLLAALLTREIYLAMWENAFFLADEPNAVKTRYKERKKASVSAASGFKSGRGGDGRRDSRDRKREDETDAAAEMITRSTILGDAFRDMWNYSPPSAYTWRTQYFSVIYQELLASSTHSSLSPTTSTSTIDHTLLTFTSTLTSCILNGEIAPLIRRLSSKEDMVMQKELCGILGRAVGVFLRLRVCGGGDRRVEVGDVGEGLRPGYWRGGVGGEMVGLKEHGMGIGGRRYDERFREAMDELDGRRVDVVVSPVVYLCGEGRGGESGRRVLVPAVVVVEDEW
ncbi:hypothetical protein BKA64DRAFT_711881 [Cadophora sp. MPI-SDFR-AT-0126]|nr:hypothetical protein BKA64DRAFT_711881 [Leotiomycetes sp. MPI-SDFR-AT-0126]